MIIRTITKEVQPGQTDCTVKVPKQSKVTVTLRPKLGTDGSYDKDQEVWLSNSKGIIYKKFEREMSVYVGYDHCPYVLRAFKGELSLTNPGSYTKTVSVSLLIEEIER